MRFKYELVETDYNLEEKGNITFAFVTLPKGINGEDFTYWV